MNRIEIVYLSNGIDEANDMFSYVAYNQPANHPPTRQPINTMRLLQEWRYYEHRRTLMYGAHAV